MELDQPSRGDLGSSIGNRKKNVGMAWPSKLCLQPSSREKDADVNVLARPGQADEENKPVSTQKNHSVRVNRAGIKISRPA